MTDALDEERRRITELVGGLADVLERIHQGAEAAGTALSSIQAGQAAFEQARKAVEDNAAAHKRAIDTALSTLPNGIADAVKLRVAASITDAIKAAIEPLTAASKAASDVATDLKGVINAQLWTVMWYSIAASVLAGGFAGAMVFWLLK